MTGRSAKFCANKATQSAAYNNPAASIAQLQLQRAAQPANAQDAFHVDKFVAAHANEAELLQLLRKMEERFIQNLLFAVVVKAYILAICKKTVNVPGVEMDGAIAHTYGDLRVGCAAGQGGHVLGQHAGSGRAGGTCGRMGGCIKQKGGHDILLVRP